MLLRSLLLQMGKLIKWCVLFCLFQADLKRASRMLGWGVGCPCGPGEGPGWPGDSYRSCFVVRLMLPVKCMAVTVHSQPMYI